MADLDRVRPRRLVRHALPDRVHVRPVQVARPVPAPAPHCSTPKRQSARAFFRDLEWVKREMRKGRRTVIRTRLKVNRHALLLGEEPVVGAEPRAVLWVRARVVGQAPEADVPPDRGQVPARGVDDLPHALVPQVRATVSYTLTRRRGRGHSRYHTRASRAEPSISSRTPPPNNHCR